MAAWLTSIAAMELLLSCSVWRYSVGAVGALGGLALVAWGSDERNDHERNLAAFLGLCAVVGAVPAFFGARC